MQDCRSMREWARLLNTNAAETPKLEQAIRIKNWKMVREELLLFAKVPDHLDKRVRRRVRREVASAELFFAAARGDLKRMRLLLNQGADANAISDGEENMTPLAWASVCDHPNAVNLLVVRGARVNQSLGYANGAGVIEKTTALNEASTWGARRAVAILLAHGADPNAKTYSCAIWVLRDDLSCEPGKVAIFNTLGLTDDPVIRRMLRGAGAQKAIVGHFPPMPAGNS